MHTYKDGESYYAKEEQRVKTTTNIDHYPEITGYNYEQAFDLDNFIEGYAHTGIQASNLARAIEIIKKMRAEKCTIYLAYTSNMVSSGVRAAIQYLAKHKMVDVLVTTAGGVEEDYIKTFKHFVLGDFEPPGKLLYDAGIQRIGNIFVPVDRYTVFEQSFSPFLQKLWELQTEQTKSKKTSGSANALTSEVLLREMGLQLLGDKKYAGVTDKKPEHPETSILYWAAKNNIPYFCPAPTDGALGDMIYFQKQRAPEFALDVSGDIKRVVDIGLNAEKVGLIILGGGVAKHHVLNAMIFRDGAEYAVYVNTGEGFDASDSGANVQEAISWGKVKTNAEYVKVHCDASIAFPLIVAGAFGETKS